MGTKGNRSGAKGGGRMILLTCRQFKMDFDCLDLSLSVCCYFPQLTGSVLKSAVFKNTALAVQGKRLKSWKNFNYLLKIS